MRLDAYLVKQGLAPSRARAAALVQAGHVRVGGKVVLKPAWPVEDAAVELTAPDHGYVGRGALKLKALLEAAEANLKGDVVLDVGASTGGFTEVCLEAGAAKVYAVDVGHNQLHQRLRTNARVVALEGTDARTLPPDVFTPQPTVMVADVSFISLTKVLPPVLRVCPKLNALYLLVKPQFEVGPEKVGRGGIVRNDAAREAALASVTACVKELGFNVTTTLPCPVAGGDGNVEWLLAARR